MNIPLDKKYSLSCDIHQWIIIDNGRMIKFFPTLVNCIDWLFKAKIKGSNAKSLEQLKYTIIKHSDRLQQLVTSLDFKNQVKLLEDSK